MTQDEIEAVAQRPTYCKTDGEAVTLSRAERDALVAMARDGLHLSAVVDQLLAHCPDAECGACGEAICPHHHPLHFHHDGCPACAERESMAKEQA